ncbi:hypothetical protein PTTG_25240 [Puccinia triticina 1-1 BBBD Race 1]|uniref:Uncharacterized protein n=1 Tax=Puccinia triticina (isolate 1-1 / race 1 (BBBD)) TaxID=630390 RepID=A0A180H3U9_PUCT1|nr:hypothetical protein PTTG_25240 [Puccinia triticina 1-1 BBBD Race 1]
MDPYSYGAYDWIQLFMANLNFVLGSLPPPTAQPAVNFNQIQGASRNRCESSQKATHSLPSVPQAPANLFKLNSPQPVAYAVQHSTNHQLVPIQSRRGPPMPQAVVQNHDQIQSEYQQQVIEDPCKRDQQVMNKSSSDFGKKPIADDDGVVIHVDLSLELNYPQELDNQSDLEIDLGPEHSHPILSLMVPMEIKSSIDKKGEAVVKACSNAEAPSSLSANNWDACVESNKNESEHVNPNLLLLILTPAAPLPLLPSLRTPFVLRRPGEQFPDHGNEDASVISTQRCIPYQSVRLARLNLPDDDSASEDKAPRLMSTRH